MHHTGWSEDAQGRPRGWSGLPAAVDVMILSERKKGEFIATLTLQKSKDDASDVTMTAHLSRVVLGRNKYGREVSTLIVDDVVMAEAVAKGPAPRSVSKSQRLLMDLVIAALDEAGEDFWPHADGPKVRGVADSHIRTRLYAAIAEMAGPQENPEAMAERQRKAFNRSIEAAVKPGILSPKITTGSGIFGLFTLHHKSGLPGHPGPPYRGVSRLSRS